MTLITPQERSAYDALFARVRAVDPAGIVPLQERHGLTVKDVRAGGFLRMRGQLWRVTDMHRYREGRWDWYELRLEAVLTGEETWLEWEQDDELEVTESVEKLSFGDLSDEDGVALHADDLDQIVGDEDSVYFSGAEYEFEEISDKVLYFPGMSEEPDEADIGMIDFWLGDAECICIERWAEGDRVDYEVWLSRPVDARSISVVARGGQ